MPSTTNYGLRYPASTDFVAAGASNFQDLAQDVVTTLNGFGGDTGQCTAGTTSGTNGMTLADYTFSDPVANMIVLVFGMIRYTQTVSTDEFRLYVTETTGEDEIISELALAPAGTTVQSSGTIFAAAQLSAGNNKQFRLFVKRTAGTGTLTVTSASNANRFAFLCLPGNF